MPTRDRGFASMAPTKRTEAQSKGGKAAHTNGKAPKFTPEKAREAQKKSVAARNANNAAIRGSQS